jgi:hypothetical protein
VGTREDELSPAAIRSIPGNVVSIAGGWKHFLAVNGEGHLFVPFSLLQTWVTCTCGEEVEKANTALERSNPTSQSLKRFNLSMEKESWALVVEPTLALLSITKVKCTSGV